MTNRQSLRREADRLGHRMLADIGREFRVARVLAGMRQADVAARIGRNASHVSRVEHGLIRGLTLPATARHAAVVGLRPWMRLFPVIARPLDRAQLALFAAFRDRIGAAWEVQLEVPMPIRGDLRAADAVLTNPDCRCVVELITRLADLQAQARAGRLKVRDLRGDRLILVVSATTTNRRAAQSAGPSMTDGFPVPAKEAFRRLASGQDPGGDCLLFLEPRLITHVPRCT